MLRHYLIPVAVLGIGIVLGYTLLPDHARHRAMPGSGDSPLLPAAAYAPLQPGETETLAALQEQLQQARQAREQLAEQLEALQLRLEELEIERDNAAVITVETDDRKPGAKSTTTPETSVRSLIDAGIPAAQAAWIQGRLDEIDLQQLYLRNRAAREGWLDKPRYQRERRQYLDAVTGLRDDIGDDAYDRMLYTLGRANRVVIRDTMVNSPAEQYGLQPGDRIIEYDGRRIFTGNELNTLVTQGDTGTMTLVRVQRDGGFNDLYLPRGPLGIRISTARASP